jgi:hypothetical protein
MFPCGTEAEFSEMLPEGTRMRMGSATELQGDQDRTRGPEQVC